MSGWAILPFTFTRLGLLASFGSATLTSRPLCRGRQFNPAKDFGTNRFFLGFFLCGSLISYFLLSLGSFSCFSFGRCRYFFSGLGSYFFGNGWFLDRGFFSNGWLLDRGFSSSWFLDNRLFLDDSLAASAYQTGADTFFLDLDFDVLLSLRSIDYSASLFSLELLRNIFFNCAHMVLDLDAGLLQLLDNFLVVQAHFGRQFINTNFSHQISPEISL
jgi:hypothetical protein